MMSKDQNLSDQYKDENTELTKNQIILYSLIIGGSITIFILSMIGINIFILLIIIGLVLIYVYFDKDIQDDDNAEILDNHHEKNVD